MDSFIDYHGIEMAHTPIHKILIMGATGFIGSRLVERLGAEGYRPTALMRSGERVLPGVDYQEGDPTKPGDWQSLVSDQDAVINLAGSTIFRRWTARVKRELLESRLSSTRNVVDAILASGRPIHLFNASGIGYYGTHGDEELDERHGPGETFLAELARQWEDEATRAWASGSRVVLCRFGIVLGKGGGAMQKMTRAVRWGLGAPLGRGRQWFSWIHEEDLVGAFLFLLASRQITGPVNFTSPYPVRNAHLMRVMRNAMGRQTLIPMVPALILRLRYLGFSRVFVKGQRVVPRVLQQKGFQFRFPRIEEAVADLLT